MKTLIVILTLVLASCSNFQPGDTGTDSISYSGDVVEVENDDKEMNKAIDNARATYPQFLSLLRSADDKESFNVKMRFEWGEDNGEHMWLGDLYFKGEDLYGTLHSYPENIRNVTFGDTLKIFSHKISDWSYIENGFLKGGYTIKVLYSRLPEADKKQLEEDLGAKIQ